jgi:tetratricopeptide (TPR) repeat protein
MAQGCRFRTCRGGPCGGDYSWDPAGRARGRRGADAAFREAIGSGQPEMAARATLSLAGLLARQGDVAGAKAAYQQLIDSGEPEMVAQATFDLAFMLAEQGDVAGATAAYQQAITYGHAEASPRAAIRLAVMLEK